MFSFTSSNELLSKGSNAKVAMKVTTKNASYATNSRNEAHLSTKYLSRSWFNRKGQEWSNEGDENHIAPVLNESEFPPLCLELSPPKKDFPSTIKQERKKITHPLKNHRQHGTIVGNRKNPKSALSCFTSSNKLLFKESNAKDQIKVTTENASYETYWTGRNEAHLSKKYLPPSWFNRKGQEWSNEGNKNYPAPLYISLPVISRKWDNSSGKKS